MLDLKDEHDPEAKILVQEAFDKKYWMNPQACDQRLSSHIQEGYNFYGGLPMTMRALIFDPEAVEKYEKQVLQYKIPLTHHFIEQAISAARRFFLNLSLFHSEYYSHNSNGKTVIKTKDFSDETLLEALGRSRVIEGKTLIETFQKVLAS